MFAAFFHDHVAIPEILWFALGLTGVGFTSNNLHRAIHRRDLVLQSGQNGDLLLLAYMYIIIDVLLLTYSLTNVGVAIGAFLLPPTNPDETISPLAVMITIALFLGQILIIGVSVTKDRVARKLEEEYPRVLRRDRRSGDPKDVTPASRSSASGSHSDI